MAFRDSTINANTSGNSVTISAPSGLQDGDIMVALFVSWKDPGNQTHTLPSGWTSWAEQRCTGASGEYIFYTLCWKRASSESGDYTFTASAGSDEAFGAIAAYSGRLASGDPLDVLSNTRYEDGDTTVRAASMDIITAGSDVVWLGWMESDPSPSLTLPSGMNSRENTSWSAIWCACGVADLLNQSTGATGNKDGAADSVTGRKHAFLIALKPAAAASALPFFADLCGGMNDDFTGGM